MLVELSYERAERIRGSIRLLTLTPTVALRLRSALSADGYHAPVHNELHGTDLVMEDFRYYRQFSSLELWSG